jgi:hypothetical protein
LRKDEGLATRARAAAIARAVAVVRGRLDIDPNIPFKQLRILSGVMTVRFLFSRW